MNPLRRELLSRDGMFLLVGAVTMLFLALDTYVSHLSGGVVRGVEWIPVYFGVPAGVLLLAAGLLSIRSRPAALPIATVVYVASIAVGAAGAYFHWVRLVVPALPWVPNLTGKPFLWVPPVLAPLAFGLVGVLGLSALLQESPPGSGVVRLLPRRTIALPLSKQRAYLLLVTLGILLAVVSASLDHAHEGLRFPWMWAATAAGVFAAVAVLFYALEQRPASEHRASVTAALLVLIATGLVGEYMHLTADYALAQDKLVFEKFVRGAPPLAPLLYAYMATLGLLAILPIEAWASSLRLSRNESPRERTADPAKS